MDFFTEDASEAKEKKQMFRLIEVKGDEMIVALKMDKPSFENISKKGEGNNHIINYVRENMPFTYQGRRVQVRTMILVAKAK